MAELFLAPFYTSYDSFLLAPMNNTNYFRKYVYLKSYDFLGFLLASLNFKILYKLNTTLI